MHRFAPVALATLLAASAPARAQAQNGSQPRAQAQAPTPFTVPPATGHFTDPANLAGERPNPRTGRELPIDGGLGPNGQPDNALGLAQILRKLNTRASLMLIVAHPDDEDGGMLAYYSRGLGARVAVLTLTRGEGGQNQMTGDFEDALGLIRTQELLSADRYMGVDTQMFGTEVDFGFSKTKAEAFQKWNHERVLYDAVRAVRIFRPLVIAAVFSGAVTDGHGQHQVSGQIAQEVFKAAGDPNVFPELTREGILPWQPLRVYARVPFSRVTPQGLYDYATGQTVPAEFTNYVTGQKFTTEPTADVTINEGATDPLLSTCAANPADLPASLRSANPADCTPLSYVQFARIGLGLQRTQIGGADRMSRPGRVDVGYHLYGSRLCAPNLPNPTPNLCQSDSSANLSLPLKSSSRPNDFSRHPERSPQGVVEGPLYFPRTTTTLSSRPEASHREAVAERPLYFAGTTTTLSSRPEASHREAVAERPLYFAGTTTTLSSRPEASHREAVAERPLYFAGTTTTLSSRPEARSAAAERPLYFAGTTTTLSSRPEASRREAAAERPLYFTPTTTILSSRPEASQREAAAERPAFLRVDAPNSNSSTKAPTARSITAQGNALGNESENEASAEGAPYNPTLANQPNFTPTTTTLSSRPKARSAAAERPLYFAGTTTTLSSRPEASQREAVAERPAFLLVDAPNSNSSTKAPTAFAAKAPTARSITAQGNALGSDPNNKPSAEGAPYNPTLANQPNFFDGIDISWAGIESLDVSAFRPADTLFSLERHIQYATAHFDPAHPDAIAPQLADALDDVNHEIQRIAALQNPTPARADLLHELKIKRGQLDQALTLSLGLSLDATTTQPDLAQGETAPVTLSLTSTSPVPLAITFNGVNGDGSYQPPQTAPQLSPGHPFYSKPVIHALDGTPFTKPYFYRRSIEQPVYDLSDQRLRNAPQTPAPYDAVVAVSYQGLTIRLARIVHDGSQPVSIVPPASVSFDSHANVVAESAKSFKATVHVENVRSTPISATLTLVPPSGWSLSQPKVSLTGLPSSKTFSSAIEILSQGPIHAWGGPWKSDIDANLSIEGDGHHYTEGFRPIGYGTLPRTNYYTPATLRVVPVDLKLPPPDKRRIAYLPGTGDDVPAALASIGLAPTILKVSDLTAANLAHFHTVVLGVRTYNAHPDLHGAPTQALLDFARNGGNVVVQYQTPEFTAADAPYPLTTHNERVVDETTPVRILEPNSPLLTTPNRITSADFNNWIEERGHGFLDTWDPHYTALTETHDPGAPAEHIEPQAPQRGGLITVQLGRGRWTYCAFALYRQLPEAVPGAFRLFVNLLTP